ncbi:MAG: biotin transporter BioY [Candidatus Caldatribacterium sp.]|uniref:biotin transporter BioY n=1 Tax=Candidatus Caldatribacterium sp. TaxID=2282143 RepID=UPI00299478C9|nr:biotin transporter BioY [Candidatus Caldatribacterium sp.]MCX7729812.1 biotin transporter BioY [Candidatus Caldatribacterium sp.]MDW8081136.1 biotin transporter BioY [Candidatus Calescibacterium sp.]
MRLSPYVMTRIALFTALCVAAAVLFRFGSSIVPFSLVPFVVFLTGFLLSPFEAFLSMFLYVLLGLLGLPVFATPPFGGPLYVLRPTFGFLLGFVLAAPCIALLGRGKTPRHVLQAVLVGMAIIYLPGLLYFFFAMNVLLGKPVSFQDTLKIAFLPFIGPDFVKAFLAYFLARQVLLRLERMRLGRMSAAR